MAHWLQELQDNLPDDTILHLVGTKADIVSEEPMKRAVAFETCVAYAADHLYQTGAATGTPSTGGPAATAMAASSSSLSPAAAVRTSITNALGRSAAGDNVGSPHSNRSSMGFWGLDLGWDCCHEVSASSGEGVEEVFRVITRRLVEQRNARSAAEARHADELAAVEDGRGAAHGSGELGGVDGGTYPYGSGGGSFRVGIGDKRRSWLGLPHFPTGGEAGVQNEREPRRRGPCCGG
jgi:hypothetical protein